MTPFIAILMFFTFADGKWRFSYYAEVGSEVQCRRQLKAAEATETLRHDGQCRHDMVSAAARHAPID